MGADGTDAIFMEFWTRNTSANHSIEYLPLTPLLIKFGFVVLHDQPVIIAATDICEL